MGLDAMKPVDNLRHYTGALGAHDTLMLRRQSQVFQVISGRAWISIDGEDIILEKGGEFRLTPGKSPALVSGDDKEPLVYTIR